MPNAIAYLALLAWPPVAVALFRSLPIERALIWAILGPYLLLPPVANFDFPLVPALDKTSIPNISAFVAVVFVLGQRVPIMGQSPVIKVLMVCFVLSPFATVLTNMNPIVTPDYFRPALRIHDSLSAIINQAIFVLPFFLARQFLATEAAQREILIALALAGIAYSLPMLLEVRLSPQLNVWIYGFFPHDFAQQIRAGGFRPVVFLGHGLLVAFFAMTTLVAAVGLWRGGPREGRVLWLLASGYLAVVLVLCKTLGAIVYALALVPLLLFFGPKMQLRVAAVLAIITIAYPILRGADLVPVETLLEQARAVSEERAHSLGFRFHNEAALLDHANEKPVFGWGGWGRNVIINPVTGRAAVLDGRWIIVIGIFGWLGYIVEFGLLGLPLIILAREARRRGPEALSPYTGPLALILGVNMIDLLPNAPLTPFTWLLAGALLGHAERLRSGLAEKTPMPAGPPQLAVRTPRRTIL